MNSEYFVENASGLIGPRQWGIYCGRQCVAIVRTDDYAREDDEDGDAAARAQGVAQMIAGLLNERESEVSHV